MSDKILRVNTLKPPAFATSAAREAVIVPADALVSDREAGGLFLGDGETPGGLPVGGAQVNSDWDATSGAAEILNKPTIPTLPATVVFVADKADTAQSGIAGNVDGTGNTLITFGHTSINEGTAFNTSTSKFQPTTAGYFWLSACVYFRNAGSIATVRLYKNGVEFAADEKNVPEGSWVLCRVSGAVYLNGTTDYVQVYAGQRSGSTATIDGASVFTNFQGFRI